MGTSDDSAGWKGEDTRGHEFSSHLLQHHFTFSISPTFLLELSRIPSLKMSLVRHAGVSFCLSLV